MKAQEKEVSMLSAGEQVIMQTALVEAMDIEQSRSETTRIMMDTGSQRTYVTEDIVKKLGLQPEGTDKLIDSPLEQINLRVLQLSWCR